MITFYIMNKEQEHPTRAWECTECHSPQFAWLKADCGEGCSMSMQDLASYPSRRNELPQPSCCPNHPSTGTKSSVVLGLLPFP